MNIHKILILIFLLLLYFPAEAKVVKGIVVENLTGRPISNCWVLLSEKNTIYAMAYTDSVGLFQFNNVTLGRFTLKAKSIGYAEAFVGPILISKLDTLTMIVQLDQEDILMEEIVVQEKRIEEVLDRIHFYERKESGWGKFFTYNDLKNKAYGKISDFLRTILGLKVYETMGGLALYSSRATNGSLNGEQITIYLDGMRIDSGFLDLMNPNDIAAIEFYHINETPAQYYGRSGSLVIWTKM